jgi:hypothetical protein
MSTADLPVTSNGMHSGKTAKSTPWTILRSEGICATDQRRSSACIWNRAIFIRMFSKTFLEKKGVVGVSGGNVCTGFQIARASQAIASRERNAP